MAVTGIGGLFFRGKDPAALTAWYRAHLGIEAGGESVWEQQAGPTLFVPFAMTSDYFPAARQWMLNLRVNDLDGMAERLRAAGIKVIRKPEWDMPGIGRFARIHDPEGNPIELWEPEE